MLQFCFFYVSQDCMSSLFVILKSFLMEFLEPKTELFWFLSQTEGTEVFVNQMGDGVREAKYELTGAFNDKVDILD